MQHIPRNRRRLAIIPPALCCMVPGLLLLSRNAHTPVNDATLGLGTGALIGSSIATMIFLRRRPCDDQTSLPE